MAILFLLPMSKTLLCHEILACAWCCSTFSYTFCCALSPVVDLNNVFSHSNIILDVYCIRYLIGCDNILAKIHTRNPSACDKVGGVIIMHIDDLRRFALLWLHKSEEVRADKAHYATNITGDIYGSGWISEMYGYSFAAAEVCVVAISFYSLLGLQASCI